MILVLVAAVSVGAWEHRPAEGGRPEVFTIDGAGVDASLIVAFRGGYADDTGLFGLTAQAQRAIIFANTRLGPRFQEQLFANGVSLELTLSRQRCNFTLAGPRQGVTVVAQALLTGLFSPRIDDGDIITLALRGSPNGPLANDTELLVQMLEPILLKDEKHVQLGRLDWYEPSRIRQHLSEFFTPANATVTLIGLDAAKLPALKLAGGKRVERIASVLATDVRREVRSQRSVDVYGYPLPPLNAAEVAGMRVMARLLREELLRTLRQLGCAYSISVTPTVNATFSGVLITIPAFDSSGLDLQPMIETAIANVVHRKLSGDDVTALMAAEQQCDRLFALRADHLAEALVNGSRQEAWSSPEYEQALADLTPAAVSQTSSALFVNERRRFYVRFRKPVAQAAPTTETKRP
jgi:predicted Zn-dependent peptidase